MAAGWGKRLPEDVKDFAVLCFARYMRPTQVCEAIKARYDITITRASVQIYDPTSRKGKDLGRKRKELFEVMRKRFVEELDDIPIANRSFRLQQLQHSYETFIDRGAVGPAMRILEQAAKEAGNFHSSERTVNLTGRVRVAEEEVTEEEMRNTVANAIAAALQADLDKAAPATVTKH